MDEDDDEEEEKSDEGETEEEKVERGVAAFFKAMGVPLTSTGKKSHE